MKRWIFIITAILVVGVYGCNSYNDLGNGKNNDREEAENANAKAEADMEENNRKEDTMKEQTVADEDSFENSERNETNTQTEEMAALAPSPMEETMYEELLHEICEMIRNPEEAFEKEDGKAGVLEVAMALDAQEALSQIGYAIEDLNNDKVKELVIGQIEEADADSVESQIYMVYTLKDGKCQLVLEGWSRNRYQYMGDNRFFYEGSVSAAGYGFGMFRLLSPGSDLSCEEFYFTDVKDDGSTDDEAMELEVWYNTSGEWDKSVSEKTDLTPDDLWLLVQEKKTQKTTSLTLTPFAKLSNEEKGATEGAPLVRVQWAEDVNFLDDCAFYDVSTSKPLSQIVFTTEDYVQNFLLLELSLKEVSESGDVEFEAYPVLPQITALVADSPLAVGVSFAGDIPCYGFQYEDENGNLHRFAMGISGNDGSILLWEASPKYHGFVLEHF